MLYIPLVYYYTLLYLISLTNYYTLLYLISLTNYYTLLYLISLTNFVSQPTGWGAIFKNFICMYLSLFVIKFECKTLAVFG